MSILIFLIILLVLILVHEFGHFFAAKRFGIRVDEFGFGFPPKLFGIKKGETEYSINLLPIGGFVKIFGENPDGESMAGPDSVRSFINKPKWQQAVVLFAGVAANFLLAWLLFSFGFISGLPASVGSEPEGYKIENAHLVLISVQSGSPAEEAGLSSGDKIVFIKSGGESVSEINPETMKSFIASHGNKKIEFGYLRGDAEQEIATVIPAGADGGTPMIGVSMDQIGTLKLPLGRALLEGIRLDWSVTRGTIYGFYNLIKAGISGNGGFSSVTGPVGLAGMVGDAYRFGFAYLASFTALISVNLAVINLVPFPALDGGRLLFVLIEKIKGSRLRPAFANAANMAGFAILIILMLLVTYHDVAKLF